MQLAVEDLKALGTPGASTRADSTELFLQSWERTWIRNLENSKLAKRASDR
jgi:hypothetical protein